jgi:hypothetical protein
MTTPHRRSWMRKYMSGRRQDPEKAKEMRTAHRFDSFIWRLSQFLSPQYDILLCEQAGPFLAFDDDSLQSSPSEVHKRDNVVGHEYESIKDEGDCDNLGGSHIFSTFPAFICFYIFCHPGGGDIFKVFSIAKYYLDKEPIKAIFGLVGTLDKQALLNHLSDLTQKEKMIWEGMIKKLVTEKERGRWQDIGFTNDSLAGYHWKAVEWAHHDDPDWNSTQLHAFLRMWEGGHRRIGKRTQTDWWASDVRCRLIASPIFDAMGPYLIDPPELQTRDHGSRP